MLAYAQGNMERDMARKKIKPRGKRRRWAPKQPNPPGEWILPPQYWEGLGAPFVDQRWLATIAPKLMELKARYDAGDGNALFEALDLNRFILVSWIAEGFAKGWGRYL